MKSVVSLLFGLSTSTKNVTRTVVVLMKIDFVDNSNKVFSLCRKSISLEYKKIIVYILYSFLLASIYNFKRSKVDVRTFS